MRLRGIAVERPLLLVRGRGGMFLRLVHQGPSPCAVSVPDRRQEGADDEREPAHESGRNGTYERADRAGIMQAYALLAAVRGAFGVGVSRTWPAMPGRAAPAAVAGERGSSLSSAGPWWD
jgi:hypothetical protein